MRAIRALGRLLAAVMLAAVAAAPAAADPTEPLSHAGRWVTDAKGRVVILHGAAVVVGGSFDGGPEQTAAEVGFRRADAKFLADQGFNVVRLGMFFRGYSPQPGAYDAGYLESFARTQRQLAREGIFTLLDFHQDQLAPVYSGRGFPDWFLLDDGLPNPAQPFPQGYFANPALNRAYDNLWANAAGPGGVGLQDRFADGWERVASRFAGEERVLGYDIFNEPWPGTEWPSCANPAGCPPGGFDQTKLTDFSNRMIAAIRGADRRHLAFYEPNLQFDVGAATGHAKVADANAGFSFHNYCLGAAPGLPAAPDPTGLCRDVGETLVFQNAEAHAEATGAALLMTEFGDTADPGIHERVAELADRFMVGWTDWAYMGSTGQIKIDNAGPPEPGNIRRERLDAVVRPYPQLLAGTPRSYVFDGKTFELAFHTRSAATLGFEPVAAEAGPRRFGRGARSEIVVPEARFPDGYGVEVEGARVASEANAPLLVLRTCEAARTVRVRVREGIGPPRSCADQGLGTRACLVRNIGGRESEVIGGGPAGDIIRGRNGRDVLRGRGGRDCLYGGAHNDVVRGGRGRDRLRCGRGRHDRAVAGARDKVRGCEHVRRR
jgi:endoglycosylceramidase